MDGVGPAAITPVTTSQQDGGAAAADPSGLSDAEQQDLFGEALLSALLPQALTTYGQTLKIVGENKDIVED